MKPLKTALVALFLCANSAQASDVTKGVRAGSTSQDSANGGYLEIGIGLGRDIEYDFFNQQIDEEENTKLTFVTNVSGVFRYQGLYIEASQGVNDGVSLGYNVWANNNWAVDIVGANAAGDASGGDPEPDYSNLTDTQRIQAIEDRDSFYVGSGIRLTGYFGNAILQYRLVTDIIDNNGIRSALRAGYSWQLKNWNYYSVVGADYNSAKTNRFWYGVTSEQASSRFPAYDIGSTVEYSGELGVTYPVSENIVFRSAVRSIRIPDDIVNGPVPGGVSRSFYLTMISYVF